MLPLGSDLGGVNVENLVSVFSELDENRKEKRKKKKET